MLVLQHKMSDQVNFHTAESSMYLMCPRAFFIQRETKAAVKGYNRCSLERVPNRAPVVTIVYDDLGLHN